MVRLSRIYTKFGDKGSTMLGDGSTVPKQCPRVCAYGEVDEANAALGLALLAFPIADSVPTLAAARRELELVQHDLFDLGADLCVPLNPGEAPGSKLRITAAQAQRLEGLIDRFNEGLPALNSFVLPGGCELSARLHLARTITRRAERSVAALMQAEGGRVSEHPLVYLNRLSDLLFVLSRLANASPIPGAGAAPGDVLWKPGLSRGA